MSGDGASFTRSIGFHDLRSSTVPKGGMVVIFRFSTFRCTQRE